MIGELLGMSAGEGIMAFIGIVGFVIILYSAIKIIVAASRLLGDKKKEK